MNDCDRAHVAPLRLVACRFTWPFALAAIGFCLLHPPVAEADQIFRLSAFPNVRTAFDAAANGNTLIVDCDRAADTQTGTLRGFWNDLTIRGTNGHRISGSLVFDGQAVKHDAVSYTNREARWLPVGTNRLALTPAPPLHVPLMMETTREAAYINQCGLEFVAVERFENGCAVIDADLAKPGLQGLRTAFFNPIAHVCGGRAFDAALARKATRLPGAAWANLFHTGDIARIENIGGTDSVDGDTHYYENVEVLSADADGLTFEPLASAYGTPFVAQTQFGRNLTIEQTVIENLTINSYKDVAIRSLKTERVRLTNCYRFEVRDVEAETSKGYSQLASFTFCKLGRVENVRASGGRSSSDNANIKFMSPIRVIASRLTSIDSFGLRNDQAMCGFFQDYCYTPYVAWSSENRFADICAQKPQGGAPVAIWFTGLRDSEIFGADAGGGDLRIHKTENVRFGGPSNRCDRITDFFETDASSFDFGRCAYVRIAACRRSAFTGAVTGGDGALQYDGRNVWVCGNAAARCESIRLHDIRSSCTNASPFIWVQQASGILIERCSDQTRSAKAWSLQRGNAVTGLALSNNTFRARQ